MRWGDKVILCFTLSLEGCQTMEFTLGDKISFYISRKKNVFTPVYSSGKTRAEATATTAVAAKKSSSQMANICLEEITLMRSTHWRRGDFILRAQPLLLALHVVLSKYSKFTCSAGCLCCDSCSSGARFAMALEMNMKVPFCTHITVPVKRYEWVGGRTKCIECQWIDRATTMKMNVNT